jgi:hypothetical protein
MDYLARVELDGAAREGDRAKLDTELAKSHFYFIIMGSDGMTGFQLPSGTYYCYETYPDLNAAHIAVSSALSRTGLSGGVFVAAVTGWQSTNLLSVLPK